MNGNEIFVIIISALISAVFSIITSLIVTKFELKRKNKEEVFDNYYARFYTLWDRIHQGRAFDFTDLSYNEQEAIVDFFIETNRYQDEDISDLVYELKTARLDNFDNNSEGHIETCNRVYRLLVDKMVNEYGERRMR